ncbi:MAG: hypothetical protein K0U74_05425 [Alphaproteobacteria bacterium]|nr:hypothetical protein [Alphaproteobacteria bacterium]
MGTEAASGGNQFSEYQRGQLTARNFPAALNDITPIDILQVASLGVLLGLISLNLIEGAFSLPIWQTIVASLALIGGIGALFVRYGLPRLLHWGLHCAIFVSGGIILVSLVGGLSEKASVEGAARIWLIFAGCYALIYLVAPRIVRHVMGNEYQTQHLRDIASAAQEERIRSQAELVMLPSHSWYLLATWVTGLTMVGSCITTAIGLHSEIVDPNDHWLLRFGMPVGLSALASLIIWAGWNFVFLRMRLAQWTISRLCFFSVGLFLLVPLTLAISTIFGIIGVGGTAGLKAHASDYWRVLDANYQRAAGQKQLEASTLKSALEGKTKALSIRRDQEFNAGSGCGGSGEGPLYNFYAEQIGRIDEISKNVSQFNALKAKAPSDLRCNGKQPETNLALELPCLKQFIDKPDDLTFQNAEISIYRRFAEIRLKVINLDQSSNMPQVNALYADLEKAQTSSYSVWRHCGTQRRSELVVEIANFRKQLAGARTGIIAALNANSNVAVPRPTLNSFPFANLAAEFFVPAVAMNAAAQTPGSPPQPRPNAPVEGPVQAGSQADVVAANPVNTTGQKGDAALSGGVVLVQKAEIPEFSPLRPFWAVVSYYDQLPGYIFLQLALDFSPAILGLAFALLAPFPTGKTRLGAWTDRQFEKTASWISEKFEGKPDPAPDTKSEDTITDTGPPVDGAKTT